MTMVSSLSPLLLLLVSFLATTTGVLVEALITTPTTISSTERYHRLFDRSSYQQSSTLLLQYPSSSSSSTDADFPQTPSPSLHNKHIGIQNEEEETETEDSLEQFHKDVTTVIKNLRSGEDTTIPDIFRESATSFLSMTYVWTDKDWERQMSRKRRYIRGILLMYRSRLLKRIAPQLIVCLIWSAVVSFCMARQTKLFQVFEFSMASLSLVSTFVAALLTLRSNQGLNRLADARSAWGRLISVSRDTAQTLAVYIYPHNPQLGILAARHLSIFGWLLKCRLREEDDSDIINAMLPKTDAQYVSNERKRSVVAIHRIRQIISYLQQQQQNSHNNHFVLPYAAHQHLEYQLGYLNRIFGRCERVKGSCIPPLYTAHVTRLLAFYLGVLPFALGKTFSMIPTCFITGAVAFAMMGLDEIGHILEQPFRLMPLHQQATNSMRDVADAFIRQPPPLSLSSSSTPTTSIVGDEKEYLEEPSYW